MWRHETIGARGNLVKTIFVTLSVYDLPAPDFYQLNENRRSGK
jgi:hypothetical protein